MSKTTFVYCPVCGVFVNAFYGTTQQYRESKQQEWCHRDDEGLSYNDVILVEVDKGTKTPYQLSDDQRVRGIKNQVITID